MNPAADSLGRLADVMAMSETGPGLTSLFLRALLLLVMLVLIALAIRFLQQRRLKSTGTSRPMEVLSALPLGQRRQAVLLRVSGRVLLLGVGEGGIRTLGRFHGADAESILRASGREPAGFQIKMEEALDRQSDNEHA